MRRAKVFGIRFLILTLFIVALDVVIFA